MLRKLIPILLALLLCGCGKAAPGESAPAPTPKASEIISAYAQNPQTAELLAKQLKQTDPILGEKIQGILDFWTYANSDLELNPILPDGLEEEGLCIIVLGYQLEADGSILPELEGRLTVALSCAEKYPKAKVLCTGGGTASNAPDITEAGQMALWLVGNGLDPERLIIEDQSMTTTQNAFYSFQILKEQFPEITSAAIVTSDYHIPWGAVLFEAQFLLGAEGEPVHIVSNAAFPTSHSRMNMLPYQLNGLGELLRRNNIA